MQTFFCSNVAIIIQIIIDINYLLFFIIYVFINIKVRFTRLCLDIKIFHTNVSIINYLRYIFGGFHKEKTN